MADKKKFLVKIIGFFIVALIFYFLGKNLFLNWQQIREYHFSLNYFFLPFSFIFLGAGILGQGLIWKKIIDFLQPDNNLSYPEAMKIIVYSRLGRYLPGKVFSVVGMVYLARNKNIFKKNLYLSITFGVIFFIVAAFLLSLLLISFFFGYKVDFLNYYLIGLAVSIGAMVFLHPKVFQPTIRWIFNKIKREPIDFDFDFNWFKKLKIVFYYSLTEFLIGSGFFCLIISLTYLGIENLLSLVGVYVLAEVLGLVVFFAPSGLGIREGTLVLFLQPYFPLNIAILISLLARVWTIVVDLFLAGGFYLFDKVKKQRNFI